MQAVKTLPTTIKEREYLGPRHRVSPSSRGKNGSMKIKRVTSSSLCLTSVMRVERTSRKCSQERI
eukprot:271986-Pelagomonas_calceolata.AAC.1